MAEKNPVKLLLNQGSTTDVVDAPAFSLTKVLATAALILTPVVSYLVKWLEIADFSESQVVTLIVAVLALLAILGAADVLARALATARSSYPANPVDIEPALKAIWVDPGEDKPVRVIAGRTRGGGAEFLVVTNGDHLNWVPQAHLRQFSS